MKIMLKDLQDVKTYCNGIKYFEGTIDIKQDRHNVDGRSFLGICSLDLTREIDVEITTDINAIREDFYKYLKKWEAMD